MMHDTTDLLPALQAATIPSPMELGELSIQELRSRLAQSLSLSAKHLAYLAAVWGELEKRGEEWRILYRRCTVEMSLEGSAEWVHSPAVKGFLRSVWSKEDVSYQRPIEVGSDGVRW